MANLWQSLLRESSVRSPIPSTEILLLGGTEVGKSSILQRWQGAKPSSIERQIAVLPSDFTSFYVPTEDDPLCQFNVWSFNTDGLASELSLLSLSIDAQKLKQTVALVAVDASKPWTIKTTLEKVSTGFTQKFTRVQWLSTLHTVLQEKKASLNAAQADELDDATRKHWLYYVEPGQNAQSAGSSAFLKDDDLPKTLPDGVLTHNLGIPVIVVVSKTDLTPEDTVKVDFVQYTVRQICLQYGAALCYTSSKTGTNCDVLKDYIMYRSHPQAFKFAQAAKLVDRNAIFVPSGYDSSDLIEQSLVGSQPRWQKNAAFDKLLSAPQDKTEDSALLHPEIRVDPNQVWLRKLEKAAGSGLADLQKSSVEASRRVEELAAARRLEMDTRSKEKVDVAKKETKDVNPKHLANFFNNLLSRPDKQKSGRLGAGDKAKSAKDVKELAEEELKKM
ncbi:unnamed protein product [Aphanomyces euteiches]